MPCKHTCISGWVGLRLHGVRDAKLTLAARGGYLPEILDPLPQLERVIECVERECVLLGAWHAGKAWLRTQGNDALVEGKQALIH